MSLIVVNINVHSNNNSSINSYNHAIQRQDPPPTDNSGSGNHDSLIDWFWGTALAYCSDPYMAAVRTWMVDLLVKYGESPALAPATAVLVSSAVLCAAPAVMRWVVRKFLK
jgi:hypothetical protein